MCRLVCVFLLSAVCICVCCTQVFADDLILLPTGSTLTTGQYRAQLIVSPSNDHGNFQQLAVGLASYEFNYVRADYGSGKTEGKLGVQWCFLPQTFITPAVSIGVRDLFSQSVEGFGGYAAMTKNVPTGLFTNLVSDMTFTVGCGFRALRGVFGGVDMKLVGDIVGQIEYDGDNWNSAVGWQPSERFRLKTYVINKERYYGAELVPIVW